MSHLFCIHTSCLLVYECEYDTVCSNLQLSAHEIVSNRDKSSGKNLK